MGLQLKTEYNKGLKNASTGSNVAGSLRLGSREVLGCVFYDTKDICCKCKLIFINNIELRMLIKKLDCVQIEK